MKPAIIVDDMLKDNLKESPRNVYYQEGRTIIPNLQRLLGTWMPSSVLLKSDEIPPLLENRLLSVGDQMNEVL